MNVRTMPELLVYTIGKIAIIFIYLVFLTIDMLF